MTIEEAIKERHSVRSYMDKKIAPDIIERLEQEIQVCNEESGLHIQLITDDPKAFANFMAHYGKFRGVQNYIALIGGKSADLDEKIGYQGERLALLAQTLGLNTCWVAMTFSKGAAKNRCKINSGEKLVCILALGYGKSQGTQHKSKQIDEVSAPAAEAEWPDWYRRGISAALLAPTATNQQKFLFSLENSGVSAKATGRFYSKIDLGIVKYHFEIGAGKDNFIWH